jgi:hypothetical protein
VQVKGAKKMMGEGWRKERERRDDVLEGGGWAGYLMSREGGKKTKD